MTDIILSSGVRGNLLSLQNTARLLERTQERLATGLRVNSALDDPTAFFTSASLNNRAADLSRLLDSISLGVQTLEAADVGIKAITDLLETAQASARQALQAPGPLSPAAAATVTGTGASVAADAAAVATGSITNVAADVAAVGTGSVIAGGDALELDATNLNIADGTTITISDGATSRTFEFDTAGDGVGAGNFAIGATDQTLSQAVTAINGELSTAGVNATVADVDGGGGTQIRVQASNATDSIQVTTGGGGSGTVLAAIGLDAIGSGPDATDRTIAPTNTTLDGITAGQTLTFTTAAGNSTVTFGTGAGQSNTRVELLAALNGGSSGATFAFSGNTLEATGANAAAGDITVNASSGASALTALGFTSGAVAQTTNATLGAITQGQTLTIDIGGTTETVTFGSGAGEVNTLAELNTRLAAIQTAFGGTAVVSADANGNLSVTAGNTIGSVTLGGTATLTTFGTNLNTTAVAPTTGTAVNNVIRERAEGDYNTLLTQITELARDSRFNGNNLLQSDNLTIFFNENSTSSLTISGVDFDANGLGLTALAAGSFQTNANIDTALNGLETAILQIRTQAGTFGSNLSVVETRQQFTSSLIQTLETGGATLVLADINEEGANLLALQTRQQLSSTALSLASQADQNVLRLFS